MNVKIISDEKQTIPRRLVTAQVEFEGKTPRRLEIKEKIGAKIKGDNNLLLIKTLKTNFKEQKGTAICLQYEDEDAMKKIEYSFRLKKNKAPKKEADESEGDTNE